MNAGVSLLPCKSYFALILPRCHSLRGSACDIFVMCFFQIAKYELRLESWEKRDLHTMKNDNDRHSKKKLAQGYHDLWYPNPMGMCPTSKCPILPDPDRAVRITSSGKLQYTGIKGVISILISWCYTRILIYQVWIGLAFKYRSFGRRLNTWWSSGSWRPRRPKWKSPTKPCRQAGRCSFCVRGWMTVRGRSRPCRPEMQWE